MFKHKLLWLLAFTIISSVFVFQADSYNFRSGHRGWVAAHSLAISDKATKQNKYLGHTCTFENSGKLDFYYFDRYPIFFSAVSKIVLSTQRSLADKIKLSRQWMNFLYILTFILIFFLVNEFISNREISLYTTLFLASGFYFIKYKDMFHYDQPAVLGMVAFLLALKLREKGKVGIHLLVLSSIYGVLSGRGYATCLLIAGWYFIDNFSYIKKNSLHRFVRTFYKRDSFIVSVIAAVFAIGALFYNVHTESKIRNVSYKNTSIFQTAKHRTGATNNKKYDFPWPSFTSTQLSRISKSFLPFSINGIRTAKKFAGGKELFNKSSMLKLTYYSSILLFLITLLVIIRETKKDRRNFITYFKDQLTVTNVTILCSGLFWMFPMKRLAAPHHYTIIYYIGLNTFLISILINFLKENKLVLKAIRITSIFFILTSIYSVGRFYNNEENAGPDFTGDFDNIEKTLKESKVKSVRLTKSYRSFVKGSPYAVCFYLGDKYISDKSNHIISDKPNPELENLTPKNKNIFLMKKN